MKLPDVIIKDGSVFDECDLIRPVTGVLADTYSAYERTSNPHTALRVLTSGCIGALMGDKTLTERSQINAHLKKAPYKSIELVALKGLVSIRKQEDNVIEGIYSCPMPGCNEKIQVEKIATDEGSNWEDLDHFNDLKIVECSDKSNFFDYDLAYPVRLNTSEGEREINSLKFHRPYIVDCEKAEERVGANDKGRIQLVTYGLCIEEVNGQAVDDTFRNKYGGTIFDRIDPTDTEAIFKEGRKYGLQSYLNKQCPSCAKKWRQIVNPISFFVSALQALQ